MKLYNVIKELILEQAWRFFRLDRIKNCKPIKGEDSLYQTFDRPPLYNPFGDKSMNRVFINSKF